MPPLFKENRNECYTKSVLNKRPMEPKGHMDTISW